MSQFMAEIARGLISLPPGRPRWICPSSSQFDLLYLSWGFRSWGKHRIPPAYQDGWHYLVILEGSPTLALERGQCNLSEASLVISHPDCAIGIVDKKGASADHLCWLWRSAPHAAELVPQKGGYLHRKLDESMCRQLHQVLAACRQEIGRIDQWTKPMIQQLHFTLDMNLMRCLRPAPQSQPVGSRLELALRWMQAHVTSRDFVTALCDYLQISPSTLGRMFEKHLNESPASHFHRLKMERARELLKTGQMSVKETAYHLGYRHANDFSRAFKKYAAHAPSLAIGEASPT